MTLLELVQGIADAIRRKKGTSDKIKVMNFINEIDNIQSGVDEEDIYNEILRTKFSDDDITLGDKTSYELGYEEASLVTDAIINRTITDISSNVTIIERNSFYSCSKLESASFPNAIEIYDNAFRDCTSLKTIYIPQTQVLYGLALRNCKALEIVDLPSTTKFFSSVFYDCVNLHTLILRANVVCAMSNINVLYNTAIEKGNGYIYVPDNLVDSYKSASNWSNFANQIKPLSEVD